MESVIHVENLRRTYRTTTGVIKRQKKIVEAVKGISFDVYRGEIFGLLGPNGAGKTTIIKILTTLLAPTSGEAKVLGYNVFGQEKQIRPRINFIFGGERSLYWRLSAVDNLRFFCDLYLIPHAKQDVLIDKLLDRVGLADAKLRKVETYSKGMKQRLQIARALLNNPEVIFLDEPSIGLDPVGARLLKKIIREIATDGKTVVLTTHYMPEAEDLCDRIAIIDHGMIKVLEDTATIKATYSSSSEQLLSLDDIYVKIVGGDQID